MMAIDWNYKKSCCDFTLYEKVNIATIIISVAECWLLLVFNVYVGFAALCCYIAFTITMAHLEKHNIIEVKPHYDRIK